MDLILDQVRALLAWEPSPTQSRLLQSLAILLVFALLRWLGVRLVYRRVDEVRQQYQWRKSITYVAFTLSMVSVARLWVEGLHSLTTFFGLLSAGLAIALQDPIVNLAGWLFLMWRRPFKVGDRIQIGDLRGDVIDMRVFQFTLLEIGNWVHADQSTGRIVHVPNGKVFREAQANYAEGFPYIWNEIPVLVTFESDWHKAKEILSALAEEHSAHLTKSAADHVRQAARKYMIFYSKLAPVVYTSVEDSGVLLTIRYLCEPRTRRGNAEVMWEAILDAFSAQDDIDFAYPTTRFYANPVEGKTGARAPLDLGSLGSAAPGRTVATAGSTSPEG